MLKDIWPRTIGIANAGMGCRIQGKLTKLRSVSILVIVTGLQISSLLNAQSECMIHTMKQSDVSKIPTSAQQILPECLLTVTAYVQGVHDGLALF